jgi:uncharacterized membrane protein YesL
LLFKKDYATPGPGIDPDEPEKTGPARLFQIFQIECGTLLKLNLLFLVTCIPVVTIPPALYAMNAVARRMVLDETVDCLYHYKMAWKENWKRAYAAFFLTALLLVFSGFGAWFYLRQAESSLIFFLPFLLCSTVLLVVVLSSAYLFGVLSTGRNMRESLRMAVLLGVGRPFRAILAVLCWYGIPTLAILEIPISLAFLFLIGFSVPCLLGNFFLRTVLKQYCP